MGDNCDCSEPCNECKCDNETIEQTVNQEETTETVEETIPEKTEEEIEEKDKEETFRKRKKYDDPLDDDYKTERRNRIGSLENLGHKIDNPTTL